MSTGQIIGGVVGAAAGALIPGVGVAIGAQVGLMLGGFLDPPKGPTIQGPRLEDLTVQSSTYGTVIPRVYGTIGVNGNIFWLEGNKLKETVTKKKSGGKGGGSKTTTKTYSYSATFAVGLCQGPIMGIKRIWIGPDLFYNAESDDFATVVASNQAATEFAIYYGTEDQLPDPRIQADVEVENAPAYRGIAYIVFYDLQLARYGNSLVGAQVKVEVVKNGTDVNWAYTVRNMPTTRQWMDQAWNGALFCAVAFDSDKVATSPDGVTWTEYPLPYSYHDVIPCIATDGKVFVTNNYRSGNSYLLSSEDGIVWIERQVCTSTPTRIIYAAGIFLVVTNGVNWYVSEDGAVWDTEASPGPTFVVWLNFFNRTVAYNGECFVAIGVYDAKVLRSTSGREGTWEHVATLTPGLGQDEIATKGLRFCLTTNNGQRTWTSDDGITWDYHTNATSPLSVNSITSGYGVFITTNQFGYDISEDGINWTHYTVIPGTTYEAVTWNGAWFSILTDNSGMRAITVKPHELLDDGVALSQVISEECMQSGLLAPSDINASALSSIVRGYRIGSLGAIRAAIEPLQAAWPFDVVQRGYVINFISRGGASVADIPDVDLGAYSVSNGKATPDTPIKLSISREIDSQLPRRVRIKYIDRVREYDFSEQYAERLSTDAVNLLSLDLTIVMTAAEAAQKADVLLYLYWMERYDASFTLPPTYLHLEPSDVVTVETPESNIKLRLTSVNYTSDDLVECKAKYADSAIYTSTAAGEEPTTTGGTVIQPTTWSAYVLLDIPTILSSQPTYSFGVAMYGGNSGWGGGVLMQSKDAGTSWASVAESAAPGATTGICSNSIGVAESRLIDNSSILDVTLRTGELFSVTELAMLNGANYFAYGADGRWEIIAAKTCTLVSGKSYTLKDMLRGRFGTEWAMSTHSAGDVVVLLDTNDVETILSESSQIGLPYLYRGVTLNRDIDSDTNRTFTYRGINLKPLSPVYVTGVGSLVTNDWTLSWIRRTRIGGEWRDGVDADLGESLEKYEVDIFSNSSYTTVKRTLTVYSQTATYTSAQQVTDFGANQTSLYFKVYQISSIVGRGVGASASAVMPGNDPYFANVVLLMPMTGTNGGTTFTDLKGHSVTRNGDVVTSTARSIGTLGSSTLFDGTTDFLNISGPNADFNFGTGDFCIEAWVYIAANSAVNGSGSKAAMIFSADYSGLGYVEFLINGSGANTGDALGVWNGSTDKYQSCTISQGAWHHIAVSRQSGVITFYLDGSSIGTYSWAVQFGHDSATAKLGGRILSSWNNCLNGNLGPLRVTKGVARYTSNFTPVQGMYPTY